MRGLLQVMATGGCMCFVYTMCLFLASIYFTVGQLDWGQLLFIVWTSLAAAVFGALALPVIFISVENNKKRKQ